MTSNLTEIDFQAKFNQKIEELGIDWDIKGLLDSNGKVYAIGSDSKLLGRIFEIIAAPVIKEIAEEHGYIVKVPEKQNTYPDFTLMRSEDDTEKIAIDIKTTYKEPNKKLGFTLGSFTSYLRNNTKNIEYPYNEYKKHLVIGFIYRRNLAAEEGEIVSIEQVSDLASPYLEVEYFVQDKINITGEKKGSGNTDNIGSILVRNVRDFHTGNGPFTNLPERLYLHYWRNYPKYTQPNKHYTDLHSYFDWIELMLESETDLELKEEYEDLLHYKQNYLDWINRA